MPSLEKIEQINQVLGTVKTYPLLLSEVQMLQQMEKKEDMALCEPVEISLRILNHRLQNNPDLSWDVSAWEKISQGYPQLDQTALKKWQNKTGFIIGL